MPFTPIHLGPGLAFKALGGSYFSFMVFGGAQVLMDIEPLIGILQRKAILHGFTHTLVGALLIGIAAGVTGKPVSNFILKLLHIPHHSITWTVSFASGFTGTFSHIILDGIMHGDMSPVWPLLQGNPLLGILSRESLHLLCLALGVIGILVLVGRASFQRED